jgi:hypothetical protein
MHVCREKNGAQQKRAPEKSKHNKKQPPETGSKNMGAHLIPLCLPAVLQGLSPTKFKTQLSQQTTTAKP